MIAMPPILDMAQVPQICTPLFSSGQEVQHGAVVPDVHNWRGPLAGNVSLDPVDRLGSGAKTTPCARESGAGYIENRDAGESSVQQLVHEAGIPASNIDDSGIGPMSAPRSRSTSFSAFPETSSPDSSASSSTPLPNVFWYPLGDPVLNDE